MLGPLVGAVGYGMTGPWREEPHPHSVPLSGGDRALAVPGGQVGREADRWRLGSLWGSRSSSGRVTLSL